MVFPTWWQPLVKSTMFCSQVFTMSVCCLVKFFFNQDFIIFFLKTAALKQLEVTLHQNNETIAELTITLFS